MNDHLSDFATRIRNAYLANKREVVMPHTNLLESVAQVMVESKYLAGAKKVKDGSRSNLHLELAYADSRPAVAHIKRVSKPGVRIYQKSSDLHPILSGLGLGIISTSKGVMSTIDARKQKLGGELLLELW